VENKQEIFMHILSNLVLITSQNIIFIFSRRKQKREVQEKEEEYKNNLLCRFVVDGIGKTVGESVAVNDDILIIKSKDKYLGVPLKHIQEKGKTLLVKGLIDNSNAELMGEKWREENFKEISHDIDNEEK
jgi:hypothetical protein